MTRIAAALLILPWCALMLPACTSGPREQAEQGPEIPIEGIMIRNDLPYAVKDVMVNVPSTGRFAGCGNILPRTTCNNAFQGVDYRAYPIVISWKEYGEPHRTDEFVIKVPDHLVPGQPSRVEVVIFAPGQAGAKLVQ